MKHSLGTFVADLRESKRLSQRDLAKKVGCSYTQISRIENDEIESPGLKLILSLSKALSVPPAYLILAFEGKDPYEITREGITPEELRDSMAEAAEYVLRKRGHIS